jgi:hypothetical protein
MGADFSGAASLTGQMAGAYAQFQNLAAAYRQERVGIKAGLKTERARIRTEAVGSMSEAINTGIESGLTGSSQVSQERVGVIAQRRADITSARNAARQAIAETHIGEQQAYLDYRMAQEQMEMQAAAMRQQAELAQQALDAQAQQSSDLMAYIKSQAEPASVGPGQLNVYGTKYKTVQLPNGKISVAGLVFEPNTPQSVMRERIWNSQQPAGTPTMAQIIARKGG